MTETKRSVCSNRYCRRESDREPGQRCEHQTNTARCPGILKALPKEER